MRGRPAGCPGCAPWCLGTGSGTCRSLVQGGRRGRPGCPACLVGLREHPDRGAFAGLEGLACLGGLAGALGTGERVRSGLHLGHCGAHCGAGGLGCRTDRVRRGRGTRHAGPGCTWQWGQVGPGRAPSIGAGPLGASGLGEPGRGAAGGSCKGTDGSGRCGGSSGSRRNGTVRRSAGAEAAICRRARTGGGPGSGLSSWRARRSPVGTGPCSRAGARCREGGTCQLGATRERCLSVARHGRHRGTSASWPGRLTAGGTGLRRCLVAGDGPLGACRRAGGHGERSTGGACPGGGRRRARAAPICARALVARGCGCAAPGPGGRLGRGRPGSRCLVCGPGR